MAIEIDVRDLVGHPGSSRHVHLAGPVEGLATELAAVPEDRPVDVDLFLQSVVEGVLASGPVEGTMVLQCARCLKPFDARFRLDVQELFTPTAMDEGDEYRLEGGSMDIEPMIRDAVVLSMPFAPLCRGDCLGLCDRCGGDRNIGECRCQPEADPGWAALSALELGVPDESSDVRGKPPVQA